MKITRPTFSLLMLSTALIGGSDRLYAQGTAFTYQGRVKANGVDSNGAGQFKFALVTSTNTSHRATASATISGRFVTIINVTFGGNGYVTPPTVSITGGGGSNATAIAALTSGAVTGVTVSNPGAGYSSAPTVTIAPPPEDLSYTTYWSNDGTSVAGSEPNAPVSVSVSSGLFTVPVGDTTLVNMQEIPSSLFRQPNLQLRIWFNDGVNGSIALNPAQNLTASPYAAHASSASTLDNGIPGLQNQTVPNSASYSNVVNIVAGSPVNFVASGVVGATISGGGAGSYFGFTFSNGVTADFGTVGGGTGNISSNYSATVGGGRGNIASGDSATVGGGSGNTASGGLATVGGGAGNIASGYSATVSGGNGNLASGDRATVGGGTGNISSNYSATVGGGSGNIARDQFATVGGGTGNISSNYSATVSGGNGNIASGNSATVGGGQQNTSSGFLGTVGGGNINTSSGASATVPGGFFNSAAGDCSFAAGNQARANHQGSFVWADSQTKFFDSTGNDQFLIRAAGGVGIGTASPQTQLHVLGADAAQLRLQNTSVANNYWNIYSESYNSSKNLLFVSSSGNYVYFDTAGVVHSASDRRLKRDIAPLGRVLDRVLRLHPVSYRLRSASDDAPLTLGLIAQEVEPLFPEVVGEHEGMKALAYSELIPVTIGALQELNQKLEGQCAENVELKKRVTELEQLVGKLITKKTQP